MRTVFTILTLIACVAASFDDDIFAGNDPKDNYFRYVRTYSQSDFDDSRVGEINGEDAPKPYGFDIYYPQHTKRARRIRRDQNLEPQDDDGQKAESEIVISSGSTSDDTLLNIDEDLKPLELDVLQADEENSTESADATVQNDVRINDFIRFKRDTTGNSQDSQRLKRDPERSGKMLLADTQVADTNREPRGAVQEKWVKQPYPIQVESRDREGRFGEAHLNGEPPNAPRVHFVTQRRSESSPPLVYHSYEAREREGRSRDLTRQRDIDLERDFEATYYRPARHFSSAGGRDRDRDYRDPIGPGPRQDMHGRRDSFYRNYDRDSRDRDFRDDRDLRDRDYNRDFDRDRDRRYYSQQDRYHEEDRPIPAIAKQKRIIYYATLPEIVRPLGGPGDRDRDRDVDRERGLRRGYPTDDRDRDNRVTSPINYRFRNEGPYENRDPAGDKSRYDEAATAKTGFPTKVSSTDVSVRALKKNPERRVYSEVGRRFTGYRHDDGPAAYDSNHR